MFLKQLDRGDEHHIQLGARVYCAAPQYTLDTFGRLPTPGDGRNFMTHVPAESRPEDIAIFAAFEGEEAIGLIQVQRRYIHPHRANIGLLLVDPAHRRRGHATAMLRQLSELSRGWPGITHFALSVMETNTVALAFWRRAGFTTVVQGFIEPGYSAPMTVMQRPAQMQAPLAVGPALARAATPPASGAGSFSLQGGSGLAGNPLAGIRPANRPRQPPH